VKNGPVAGRCRHTKLICWGECWGKEPRRTKFGFIVNGLAATDGGVVLRHMPLIVIGHDHSLMLTSIPGSRWLALVLAIISHFGQEKRRTLGQ
jgi:hypothetical protein